MKFGFFEYAIVGLPILIAGILFYATIGYRLLPNHDAKDEGAFDTETRFQQRSSMETVVISDHSGSDTAGDDL